MPRQISLAVLHCCDFVVLVSQPLKHLLLLSRSENKETAAILQVEEVPTKRISMQNRGGLAPVIIEGAETAVLRGANYHASQDYPQTP